MVQEINPQAASESLSQPASEGRDEEWREEFPYPWDEDEVVTRRDTLRFLLAGRVRSSWQRARLPSSAPCHRGPT